MKTNFRHLFIGTLSAGAALFVSALGTAADTHDPALHAGRASVYRNLPAESLERTGFRPPVALCRSCAGSTR